MRLIAATEDAWQAFVPAGAAYVLRYAGWLDHRYAHLVGLDNRWQMFGFQTRFTWRYLIKAHYADGSSSVLPLPRQSPRTFWETTLSDFKEAKFHLNIYSDPRGREAYAHYLCRQYPSNRGSSIESIRWDLVFQTIVEPAEARRRGSHLEPERHEMLLDTFRCQ